MVLVYVVLCRSSQLQRGVDRHLVHARRLRSSLLVPCVRECQYVQSLLHAGPARRTTAVAAAAPVTPYTLAATAVSSTAATLASSSVGALASADSAAHCLPLPGELPDQRCC